MASLSSYSDDGLMAESKRIADIYSISWEDLLFQCEYTICCGRGLCFTTTIYYNFL